ncbi:MAG: NYN domain-containing protein [Propionibacteriaceae bacterium]|nr:NYN domain-containing protein [Propionibacteriaceae bacterium]
MPYVPSALYLDFDNVFTELRKHDPESAVRFAEQPEHWLERLTLLPDGRSRRWFVLRCYLNPAGWPESVDGAPQTFGRYRSAFVRAGFEVVDCPRLAGTKNAADIRMALDVLDSLAAVPRPQEYVLGSADSDFTPLLIRLRAAGRSTTLISSREVAPALAAVASRVLGPAELVGLVGGEPLPERAGAFGDFARLVQRRYQTSNTPIPLAALAAEAHQALGPEARTSKWYGYGSFTRALAEVGLGHSRIEDGYLSDARWAQPAATPRAEPAGATPRRALPQSPRSPEGAPVRVSPDGRSRPRED